MRKRMGIILCILLGCVCLLFGACGEKGGTSASQEEPTVKILLYETLEGENVLYAELNVYASCHGLEQGIVFFGYDETGELPERENYVFKGVYDQPNGAGTRLIADTGHSEINFYPGNTYTGYIYFKKLNFDEPTRINPVQIDGAYFAEEMPEFIAQGEQIALPIPYVYGKEFTGWRFTDGYQELITDGRGNMLKPWDVPLFDVEIYPIYKNSDLKYLITNEDFLAIPSAPNATYELVEDLDLTGAEWNPCDFGGTLLGYGKTVKGIQAEGKGDLGVFLNVTGTVSDLVLENVSVVSPSVTSVNVGGFCAKLSGNLTNVTVKGKVEGDYANIGGIVGLMEGGSLLNCKNEATVSTMTYETESTCGGIAGLLKAGEILGCTNSGSVSGYGKVGGVIGAVYPSKSTKTRELLNSGKVVGRSDCVGGIIGDFISVNYVITTSEYENQGDVSGKNLVGGIFGNIHCTINPSNDDTQVNEFAKLLNSGNVVGENSVGGCVGKMYFNGYNQWGRNPKMEFKGTDFVNTGDVTGVSLVGGTIGEGYAQVKTSVLVRSSSSGSLTAKHTLGGIAGKLENIGILSCSNEGTTLAATEYSIEEEAFLVRLGGFVGHGYAVEDCHNKADLIYELKGNCVGGIAGIANGNLTDCSNEGKIEAPLSSNVGGIVGFIDVNYEYVGADLSNAGSVTGNDHVGGVIGRFVDKMGVNSSQTYTAKLLTLTNTGNVIGGSYSGGVVGYIEAEGLPQYGHNAKMKVLLTNVTCKGNVDALGTQIGALIGYISTDSVESLMNVCSFEGALNEETENVRLIGGYAIHDEVPCIRIE